MVILTSPYGQISNNFFQHIHLDSFCKEKGIDFYNPFLRKVYSDYPGLRINWHQEIMNSIIPVFKDIRLLSLFKTEHFDIDNPGNHAVILKSRLLLCDGWFFRSFDTTIKYRSYYQNLFNPNIDKEGLKVTYLQKTSSDQLIIGVHIRRCDYKYHTNGIYYYNDSTFIDKIKQLINYLETNNYRLLLFSDDQTLNIKEFEMNFKDVAISRGSETVDHFLMSKCDYIIGPPSTFSLWASYIGETPFYHIKSADDLISLDKFSICNG
jgi:hypothetical protein